jgi:cytochrome c peroxidase
MSAVMKAKFAIVSALAFAACSRQQSPVPAAKAATAAAANREGAQAGAQEQGHEEGINRRLLRRFQPVVGQGGSATVTPDKVALGRMLFYDVRLSKAHNLSCNSCHDLSKNGADGLPTSRGHKGQMGSRNAPTVYNAATHIAQFWDGRAETVEQQAQGPIVNPIEMANNERRLVQTLSSIPAYVEAFRAVYPKQAQPISLANVGDAIGAFERGLVTKSRWDDFLAGNDAALTAEEKHGLRTFLNVGCVACHTGPQVGASMYQRVGVMEPWPNQKDVGRAAVTKTAGDRMMFKVPSLKNIADTGPYFHDGSADTLEDAIRAMGRYQVGVTLSEDEVKAIATWMRALSGKADGTYIAMPSLPASTDRTPKPVVD